MEKPTNEERNEPENQPTQVDVSKMSTEQLQHGINSVVGNMTKKFVVELKQLEEIVARPVNVSFNGKLPDGRKIHIRVK